jgi:hypothetical protein
MAEAQAEADVDRLSPRFEQYCCHDYSVWQNNQSGNFTVVVGKNGSPGTGWIFKKGDLCCEDAYTYAGLPNAESCGAQDGFKKHVCGIGYKWDEEEAGWTSTWVRSGTSNVFNATYTGPAGQRASTVNLVRVLMDTVSITRTSSSDNILCNYTGQIAPDGLHITGTYACAGAWGVSRPWKAKINCDVATPKTPQPPAPRSDIDFSGIWVATLPGPSSCGGDRYRYTLSLSRRGATEWQGTLNIKYESECNNKQYYPDENHTIRLLQGAYPGSAKIFRDGEDTGNQAIYYKESDSLNWEGFVGFKRK